MVRAEIRAMIVQENAHASSSRVPITNLDVKHGEEGEGEQDQENPLHKSGVETTSVICSKCGHDEDYENRGQAFRARAWMATWSPGIHEPMSILNTRASMAVSTVY